MLPAPEIETSHGYPEPAAARPDAQPSRHDCCLKQARVIGIFGRTA
jgi:hypothetical protein